MNDRAPMLWPRMRRFNSAVYGGDLETPLGRMNRINAYQERGATLREIAKALNLSIGEVHREVTQWLGRRE